LSPGAQPYIECVYLYSYLRWFSDLSESSKIVIITRSAIYLCTYVCTYLYSYLRKKHCFF
jgi:hypothetical protein